MTSFFSKEKSKETISFDSESAVTGDLQFNRNDILICATHGNIYAIHKKDGSRLWRSGFPNGSMGSVVSLFVTDNDKLLVGSRGRTACMDLMTGKSIWLNKMPGFGLDEVSIITTPSRFLKPNNLMPAEDPLNELPPDYAEKHESSEKPVVIAGTRGKVMAVDVDTGETLWTYNCPGGWYKIPVMIVEPPSLEDGRPHQLVYVGSGRYVYCLRALTGEVLWTSKVSSSTFGLSYMTLATPWNSRLAAEAYTAFSQQPSAQSRDRERESEHGD